MNDRVIIICFSLFFILSSILCFSSVSADVTLDDTIIIQVDNENYTFPAGGINFSYVAFNESGSWIRFNNTGWNVTSTNNINITVSYLNNNIAGASTGDSVLEFQAETSAGTVWFNLSSLTINQTYTLNVDQVAVNQYTANATGVIHFPYTFWSSHTFELVEGNMSLSRLITINYNVDLLGNADDVTFQGMQLWIIVMIMICISAGVIVLIKLYGGCGE